MIKNGIGQFAAVKNRNGGRTRELDDLGGWFWGGWFRDRLRISV
jgi:hypothetical protein